ncbi:unnamed protein product [Didymodactylos carnosus]|uniref:EGF-like domain-containing protein n=1 Tax=Didymodactylos carnosus TaxID=1234261 RepID=A0A8S2D6B4_9BILA|nr:unnamed protein product [Didymodactylos carnosus]CAF3671261.1 unnamed protein product [Didymodactylos carnosus]
MTENQAFARHAKNTLHACREIKIILMVYIATYSKGKKPRLSVRPPLQNILRHAISFIRQHLCAYSCYAASGVTVVPIFVALSLIPAYTPPYGQDLPIASRSLPSCILFSRTDFNNYYNASLYANNDYNHDYLGEQIANRSGVRRSQIHVTNITTSIIGFLETSVADCFAVKCREAKLNAIQRNVTSVLPYIFQLTYTDSNGTLIDDRLPTLYASNATSGSCSELTISDACVSAPCLNNGTCRLNDESSYFCFCLSNYSGVSCEISSPGRDTTALDLILNGTVTDYDRTAYIVIQRNTNWTNMLDVVDVTGSMDPYDASVYLWLRLTQLTSRTQYYVFFNDGNDKSDSEKVIGSTGGLYGVQARDPIAVLQTMKTAIRNGNGGDASENDIEAIIRGQRDCSTCTTLVHVADNKATPRDLILLSQVTLPVKVIACGATDRTDINPALIYIAETTHGSIHTITEDITSLAGAFPLDQIVVVGSTTYILRADGFHRL